MKKHFKIWNTSLLFIAAGVLAGCNQSEVGEGNSSAEEINDTEFIQQAINEKLGVEAYVPKHEDYPATLASVEYLFTLEDGEEVVRDEPKQATVTYQASTEELFEGIDVEAWEEENRSEVLYGDFYQGSAAVTMNIRPQGGATLNDSELIEISGQEVQYQFLERENGNFVFMLFEAGGVGYFIIYLLIDGQTEEDAKGFAQEIIDSY
ncbi:hypothetical protein DHX103_13275 [Planococcus sp. X10-3]|uniref:hypothetical protein n=1 Tax=Planococcus sp. X10-3 TaxID=3061240 RepID=UPI003BAFAE76